MTMEDAPGDDWEVACSDDEKYDPTGSGAWEPEPQEMRAMFERLAKGERLELEWRCVYGRRSPTPERREERMDAAVVKEVEPKEEEKVAPTEFDFDEFGPAEISNPITPRRTPGSAKTPRSTKRVARLDKIMDDIRRHKKLNEEGEKVSKPKTPAGSPGSTPQPPSKGHMSPKRIS